MPESPPPPASQSYLTPIHLDPNLQVLSPHVSDSSTTTPLQIISPVNWGQSPSQITGQALQLAIIPPSVNATSWNLSRSNSLTQQFPISNSPLITMAPVTPGTSTQKEPSSDAPKKKRKYTRRKTSDSTTRTELNSEGKSAIVLIIEWLGTATTTGTRYDWWKGEMDMDTRTIYSKKDVGEKVADYLAEQGLPGRDGKGVETQIRTLQSTFTIAQDFRSGTGQGILEDLEQQARLEKTEMGYLSDSDEWKAIEHSTKSKFDQLLFQRCVYYYDLLPFMSTRTNVIPQSVRESGDVLDEDSVLPLPSTKRTCSHSPDSNISSLHKTRDFDISPLENNGELTQDLDFTISSNGPDIISMSQARRSSPSPDKSSKGVSAHPPPGRPAKRPRSAQIDNNQGLRSTSSSASDVHNLLSSQLPSREEKSERIKLEKDRWLSEEKYMKAEQDARQEELKTQAKLADALSRHLSGGDDALKDSERTERAQIKLEQDRVELDLAKSQLARSREDLITARSERKLAMLAKYKALGLSMEEAKKEVEEQEEQLRRELEG
ncbi:uncharacterized protein MELLADRAFT_85231 [Melampsora larici-populina 98AG31]|uniref:Uncharacterized protein n=1 Tax=Melampsora larici-populina (strain 98AG31 / pathotype 3-4-7) TaxID=747676 RepID=F4RI07_MELLP|nr:uncharacterized protein MELLADRAFT_85231 [Melampsora larici-populina 98AG31]EGG08038.1 hypothetical protein MELLADRAFT_85231 [Melampsora larici-populina 98AG31]